jgi:hypothetical protein
VNTGWVRFKQGISMTFQNCDHLVLLVLYSTCSRESHFWADVFKDNMLDPFVHHHVNFLLKQLIELAEVCDPPPDKFGTTYLNRFRGCVLHIIVHGFLGFLAWLSLLLGFSS